MAQDNATETIGFEAGLVRKVGLGQNEWPMDDHDTQGREMIQMQCKLGGLGRAASRALLLEPYF